MSFPPTPNARKSSKSRFIHVLRKVYTSHCVHLGVLGDAVIHAAVARLQGQDLGPAGDHVGLGAAPHLDGDGLVIAGQENCLPLHRLKLPGDAGRREAPGLAVQGQVGALRTIRVLKMFC